MFHRIFVCIAFLARRSLFSLHVSRLGFSPPGATPCVFTFSFSTRMSLYSAPSSLFLPIMFAPFSASLPALLPIFRLAPLPACFSSLLRLLLVPLFSPRPCALLPALLSARLLVLLFHLLPALFSTHLPKLFYPLLCPCSTFSWAFARSSACFSSCLPALLPTLFSPLFSLPVLVLFYQLCNFNPTEMEVPNLCLKAPGK